MQGIEQQRGLGGPREATGSRVFSPSQRFGLYSTRKFFRSSYDLFLQALLLFFNRSVKRYPLKIHLSI